MSCNYYVLGSDGRTPVACGSLKEWERTVGPIKVVAEATVGDVIVTTVFGGLNRCLGSGPPLVFQTTMRGPDDDERLVCNASTWADAERDHATTLRLMRDGALTLADVPPSRQRQRQPLRANAGS